jgi:glycolate oxidase FAD binding subunit
MNAPEMAALAPWAQEVMGLGIAVRPAELSACQQQDLGQTGPAVWVQPEQEEQVTALLRFAHEKGLAVLPMGAGTGLASGAKPRKMDVLLDLSRLDRIVDHAAEDFVVTVQSGCRLKSLQQAVASSGQWLALEPGAPEEATLGGLIGAAPPSLLSSFHGSLRQHLLGIRVVQADGTVTKAGGAVVKNVAGYDLMKLFHGACGTLVVTLQATLRLRPVPECDRVLHGPCSPSLAMEDLAPRLRRLQVPVVAAHFLHRAGTDEGTGLVRLQGNSAAIDEQAQAVHSFVQTHQLRVETSAAPSRSTPMPPRELTEFLSRSEQPLHLQVALSGLPSQLAELHRLSEEMAVSMPVAVDLLADLCSGLMLLRADLQDQGQVAQVIAPLAALRRQTENLEAPLSLLCAPQTLRAEMPEWRVPPSIRELGRRLRQQLDPAEILAPGRMEPDER